ncbi:MAG: hypothetical protein CVU95_02245, partial [Firmicutes bacterium HGW-Firmicutes-2]
IISYIASVLNYFLIGWFTVQFSMFNLKLYLANRLGQRKVLYHNHFAKSMLFQHFLKLLNGERGI